MFRAFFGFAQASGEIDLSSPIGIITLIAVLLLVGSLAMASLYYASGNNDEA